MSESFLQWLTSNEIDKYYQVLINNDINTIDLVKTLSVEDLKEIGVSLGDRKRFEKAFLGSGKIYTDVAKDIIDDYSYVIGYFSREFLRL